MGSAALGQLAEDNTRIFKWSPMEEALMMSVGPSEFTALTQCTTEKEEPCPLLSSSQA
eukprot:COSAG01_NODE_3985_length_5465_cov_3.480432_2_plen_58_part_00